VEASQKAGLQSAESGKEKVERHLLFLYQTPLVACQAPAFSILLIDRTPETARLLFWMHKGCTPGKFTSCDNDLKCLPTWFDHLETSYFHI